MAIDFSLDCAYDGQIDPITVRKVFYVLASTGTTYNVGKYPGNYLLIRDDGDDIDHWEDESDGEMVERLAEIVEEFVSLGLDSTILSTTVADTNGEALSYVFSVLPRSDSANFRISSSTADVETAEQFLRLADVAAELCERFDVRYAAYRNEHESTTDPTGDELTGDAIKRVTYLGSDLVERIGREKLLSTPAHEIREFDSGGVFLIATPEPRGDRESVERAREHLLA